MTLEEKKNWLAVAELKAILRTYRTYIIATATGSIAEQIDAEENIAIIEAELEKRAGDET